LISFRLSQVMWVYVGHKKNIVTLTACNICELSKFSYVLLWKWKGPKLWERAKFLFSWFLQITATHERVTKLEQDKEHWMLESQLLQVKYEKEVKVCALSIISQRQIPPPVGQVARVLTDLGIDSEHITYISHWLHLLAVMHCTWSRLHPFLVKQFNFLDIVHCGRTSKTVSAFSEKQGSLCF